MYLGVPFTRPFYGETVRSLLLTHWPDVPSALDFVPYMAVDLARNSIARSFLASEMEYLWFVDNDATFHPEALRRLMSHKLPMVCGTMYTRALPPTPTIGKYAGRSKEGKHYYHFGATTRSIVKYAEEQGVKQDTENDLCLPASPGDLEEIDGCGMHFTLLRRDVLQALDPPYFVMGGASGAGEDFYFCQKVQQAGFPIYWDKSVHTGHVIGEGKDYGLRELLAFMTYVDQEWGIGDDDQRWEIDFDHQPKAAR